MEVALPKEQSVTPKDEDTRLGRALGMTPDYVTVEFDLIMNSITNIYIYIYFLLIICEH